MQCYIKISLVDIIFQLGENIIGHIVHPTKKAFQTELAHPYLAIFAIIASYVVLPAKQLALINTI